MRFLIFFYMIFCGLELFAQGPNPQVGMRVGGSKNPNTLCEGDTLWLSNLTQDTSKTVAYYVFNWNWKEESFYPNYRDTLYNKDSVYHIYRFHDTIVYKNCKDRSKKLYVSLTAVDTFNDEFEIVSNIVMYLEPRSSFSGPPNACLGDDVTFTSASCPIDTSISFLWELDGKTYTTANVTHKFTTPGKHKVKLTQSSGNPCPKSDSTVSYIDIYEYPLPDMLIQTLRKNNSFCFGKDTLKLINRSTRYTSFVWTVSPGDSTRLKWISPTHPSSDTARILPLQLGQYSVQLTAWNYICRDTTKTTFFNVIVSPEVKIKPIPDCLPDTGIVLTSYLDTSSGLPDAYFWKLTGPSIADSGSNLPSTNRTLNYGMHYFSFHSNGICDTFRWMDSFFVKSPIHKEMDSLRLCNAVDTNISLHPFFPALPTGFGTTWKPDSLLTGQVFNPLGKAPGFYTLYLNDSNSSCYFDSIKIQVAGLNPQKFRDTLMCLLKDSMLLSSKDPGRFSGNGIVNNVFYPSLAGAGISTIIFVSDTSVLCVYRDTFLIEVTDTFTPSMQFPNIICNGKPVTFTNTTGVPSQKWIFSDFTTSTDSNAVKTFNASGNFSVKLIAGKSQGCIDTAEVFIHVIDTPALKYGMTVDSSTCDSFYLNLFFMNIDSSLQYTWIVNGDSFFTDSAQFGFKKGLLESFIPIAAISANICESKKDTLLLRIPPIFNSNIGISGPPKQCTPYSATFNYGIYGHYDSFFVDYGNGQFSKDTLHSMTYYNPSIVDTTFVIRLTSWSSHCGISKDSVLLTVAPNNIQPAFTVNNPGCKNVDFNFVNTAADSIELWRFGDGQTSLLQNPVHQYNSAGEFQVMARYFAPFGCKDSLSLKVVVFDKPLMNHTYSLDTSACDSADLVLYIINSDTAQTYTWNANSMSTNGDTLRVRVARDETSEMLWPYKVQGASICGTISDSALIRIPPKFNTQLTLIGPSKKCTPFDASFTYSIYGQYDSFVVDYGNGQTSVNSIHSVTYQNAGTVDSTILVHITSWSSKCGITADSVWIIVAPNNIQPAYSVNNPGCKNTDFNFINQSSDSIALWRFGDGKTSTLQNPVHQYTSAGEFQVMAHYVAPFGCRDSLPLKVVVFDKPLMNHTYTVDTSDCDTAEIAFFITNPDTAQTYTWNAGGSTRIGDTVRFRIGRDNKNEILLPYSVQGTNICGLIVDSAKIRIPPKFHTRLLINGPNKKCTPFTASFNYSIYGQYDSFMVDYGNGQFSKNSLQSVTYYNSTTVDSFVTVRMTTWSAQCGTSSDSVVVTIAPNNISPGFTVNNPGCVNTQFNFVNTSSDSIVVWHFGNGDSSLLQNPGYVYKKTGPTNITAVYKAPWGCRDTAYRLIRVIDKPDFAHRYQLDSNFCDTVKIYAEVLNPDTINTYTWKPAGLPNSANWLDTFTVQNKYLPYYQSIEFIASNICGQVSITDSFYISTGFTAEVVINGINNGCSPFIPSLDNHSTGKVKYFRVDYGNGDTSINRIKPVTFYNTTAYMKPYPVVLTAYNEYCDSLRDTTYVYVRPVLVKPYAEFARSTWCLNEQVTFINNSSPEAEVRFFWGDGTIIQKVQFGDTLRHSFAKPGIYNVQVEAKSCGKDTSIDYPITIEGIPTPDFKSATGTLCAGEISRFIRTTDSAWVRLWRVNGVDTAYRLDSFGKRFSGAGTHSVEMVIESYTGVCRDSVTKWFSVNEAGRISHSANNRTDCVSHSICVSVQGNISNYSIDWDNGNVGGKFDTCQTYTYSDTFMVRLKGITPFGCPASDSFQVFTHPPLPTGIVVQYDSQFCDKVLVSARALNTHPLISHRWSVDTIVQTTPQFRAYIPKSSFQKSIPIRLIASNLCSQKAYIDSIKVGKQTHVILGMSGSSEGCSPLSVNFFNLTEGVMDSFEVHYGDGTKTINNISAKTFVNNSDTVRTFKVVLMIHNRNCPPESDTLSIRVSPNQVKLGAQFMRTTYCQKERVSFINRSSPMASLVFYFGDGSVQSGVFAYGDTLSHDYLLPGNYSISVKSNSPCLGDSTFLQNIKIVPAPIIQFDINQNPSCQGTDVMFFNQSNNLSNTRWIVDGTDSFDNVQPLVYNFATSGSHTVLLKGVSLPDGCANALTKTFEIYPRANFTVQIDTPICEGGTSCVHVRGDVTKFQINWGNGAFGDQTDTCIRYDAAGDYPIQLNVFSSTGCLEKVNRSVKVYPPPMARILPDLDRMEIPLGSTANLRFDSTQNYRRFYWTEGGDTLCSYLDPNCKPLQIGPFALVGERTYRFILMDPYGCMSADEITVRSTADAGYYVPNAFSPHHENQLNQTFRPFIVDENIREYEMIIFNRWGEILYKQGQLTRESAGWDGKYMGDYCEPEVYGVIIVFTNGQNVTEQYSGYVMLVR